MRPHIRPAPCIAAIAAALLAASVAACGSDLSGPHSGIELSTARAAPLAMISVAGLASTVDEVAIEVGGTETTLTYDPGSGTHRFIVPLGGRGSVAVHIPASAAGGSMASLQLQVLPMEYPGGTVETAAAELDQTLASLQANALTARKAVEPSVAPELAGVLDKVGESASAMRTLLPTLSAENREILVGLYASNRRLYQRVAVSFATQAGQLAAPSMAVAVHPAGTTAPPRAPVPAGALTALSTAESLSQICREKGRNLEMTEDMLEAAGYFQFAFPTLVLLLGRDAQLAAGIGLTTNTLVVGLNAAVAIQSLQPRFFDPKGLRLEPSRVRVPENGRTAELRAYLTMVNARDALGDAAELGEAVGDYREYYRGLDDARRLAKKAVLRRALIAAGQEAIARLLEETFELMDELAGEEVQLTGGEIQIAMDGLEIIDVNNSGLWRFTSPAQGEARTFETVGQIRRELGYEIVALYATAGRGEGCRAQTDGGHPQEGLNGFMVTGPPVLKSARSSFVSLNSCQTTAGTGSLYDVYVTFTAANTLGPGSRMDIAWSFPDGTTGAYWVVNQDDERVGTSGDFWFWNCSRFAQTSFVTLRITATDPEGLQSNTVTLTINKPAGGYFIAPSPTGTTDVAVGASGGLR
jgi:hypothetical protein